MFNIYIKNGRNVVNAQEKYFKTAPLS